MPLDQQRLHQVHTAKKNNKLGVLGVSCGRRGLFIAQIQVLGRNHFLGGFRQLMDASDAYIRAKRAMHAGGTI